MEIQYSIMSNKKIRDKNGKFGFKNETYTELKEDEILSILLNQYKEDYGHTMEDDREYKISIEKIIL